MKTDYLVLSDGGSRGNGSKNEAYGSYQLTTSDGRSQIVRLHDLGTHTNNEAEYLAAIHALQDLVARIERAGHSPHRYTVELHTDSQLVVNQVTGVHKIRAANIRPLAGRLIGLLGRFNSDGRLVTHVPRTHVVQVLGH